MASPSVLSGEMSLDHLLGDKDEDLRFLPSLSATHRVAVESCKAPGHGVCGGYWAKCDCGWKAEYGDRPLAEYRAITHFKSNSSLNKQARKHFTEWEKLALIDEQGEASNLDKLDVTGTHYETQTPSEIALSILPLKGL